MPGEILLVFVLFIGWVGNARALDPLPPTSQGDERVRVIATVRQMLGAAMTDDLKVFQQVVSRDFYAYDGGGRYVGDALMALIKKQHALGTVYVWSVTEAEVHIYRDVAWITYANRGSVTDRSGTRNATWLESAILRKDSGDWRIVFLHSTRSGETSSRSPHSTSRVLGSPARWTDPRHPAHQRPMLEFRLTAGCRSSR